MQGHITLSVLKFFIVGFFLLAKKISQTDGLSTIVGCGITRPQQIRLFTTET